MSEKHNKNILSLEDILGDDAAKVKEEEKKPEIKYTNEALPSQSSFNGLTVEQIQQAEKKEGHP